MPKPQPKKHFQIQRLFGLAKPKAEQARMDTKDYLGDLAYESTNTRTASLAELTFDEANRMIVALGGEAFKLISRRTANYHKQQAGIETIVTAAHLEKLASLWAAVPERTSAGLERLCQRTIGTTRPRTAHECNAVVEAVKSMNKRARGDKAARTARIKAHAQSFRRVA